ncbi:hypothetical protein PFISCL1PPCAC_5064, partial [Pristionchus fissidentatus]
QESTMVRTKSRRATDGETGAVNSETSYRKPRKRVRPKKYGGKKSKQELSTAIYNGDGGTIEPTGEGCEEEEEKEGEECGGEGEMEEVVDGQYGIPDGDYEEVEGVSDDGEEEWELVDEVGEEEGGGEGVLVKQEEAEKVIVKKEIDELVQNDNLR